MHIDRRWVSGIVVRLGDKIKSAQDGEKCAEKFSRPKNKIMTANRRGLK